MKHTFLVLIIIFVLSLVGGKYKEIGTKLFAVFFASFWISYVLMVLMIFYFVLDYFDLFQL